MNAYIPVRLERARFFNACRILMNIDKHELVERGIMHDNEGGNDWKRFNEAPLLFMAKLDDPKADALWALIDSRQGKRLAWPFEATIPKEAAQ